MSKITPIRITVGDERSINIGSYESHKLSMFISFDAVDEGQWSNKVTIADYESVETQSLNAEEVSKLAHQAATIVKARQDKREKAIRLAIAGDEGVPFDHEEKAVKRGLISEKEKTSKFSKRFEIESEDDEDERPVKSKKTAKSNKLKQRYSID